MVLRESQSKAMIGELTDIANKLTQQTLKAKPSAPPQPKPDAAAGP